MGPRFRGIGALLLAVCAAVALVPVAGSGAGQGHAYGLKKHINHIKGAAGATTPSPTPAAQMQYGGSSILATPKVYLVFWGSEWQSGFSTGAYSSGQAQNYISAFFGGVGASSWLDSTT